MSQPHINKDLYQCMGLSKNATDEDIKKAYKKCVKENHPDKTASLSPEKRKKCEDKFKEVSHAYSVLSDTEKRREYDTETSISSFGGGRGSSDINIGDLFKNFASQKQQQEAYRNMHTYSYTFARQDGDNSPYVNINIPRTSDRHPMGFDMNHDFNDIFTAFSAFNQNPQYQPTTQKSYSAETPYVSQKTNSNSMPRYSNMTIKVDILDAVYNNLKRVKYTRSKLCERCNGSRIRSNTDIQKCLECNGIGGDIHGVCYACNGIGSMFKNGNRCPKCYPDKINPMVGVVMEEIQFGIRVPYGIKDGHVMQKTSSGSYNPDRKEYNTLKITFKYNLEDDIYISGKNIIKHVKVSRDIGETEKIKVSRSKIDKKEYALTPRKYLDTNKDCIVKGAGLPDYNSNKNHGNFIIKISYEN